MTAEHRTIEPSLNIRAEALRLLLESDFCQSDRAMALEAIRCELEATYQRGREDEAHDRL
jgi:hypothetical protein